MKRKDFFDKAIVCGNTDQDTYLDNIIKNITDGKYILGYFNDDGYHTFVGGELDVKDMSYLMTLLQKRMLDKIESLKET